MALDNIDPGLRKAGRLLSSLAMFWLASVGGGFGACAAEALEPVTMQLRWLHQFQFAGYYAALHKGYYRDAGIDVTIVAGAPGRSPVAEVLAGRAQYGEANSELLRHYLKGDPLVALASVFQHSASVLLARRDSGIRTPQDMVGRRVMMVGGTEDVDFLAMLANEGISAGDINIIPSSYDIRDIIEGRTDLFDAYLTNEPFYLKEAGIEAQLLEPVNYGVDFYSDILFTSRDELARHPKRVKAFREATLRGWEYAMAHKSEIIDLILADYGPVKGRAHLEYEAEAMEQLILPKLVALGHMNPGRFRHMADTLVKFGLADPGYSLDRFICDPDPKVDRQTYLQTIFAIGALLLLSGLVAFSLWKFNQRLSREIAHGRETEKRLEASESHYRGIIENLQDVYYRADNDGVIVEISPSVEEVMGYRVDEVVGTPMADYYAPSFNRERVLGALREAGGHLHNYEMQGVNKQGDIRWVSVNIRYVIRDGETVGVEGTIRDISEKRAYEEKILNLAMCDPLTGIPNRRALIDDLEHALAAARRRDYCGGLLFIDLNGFKPVNDRYGHRIGDALLIAVAVRLNELLRGEDVVYRVGGDEFIVLLPHLEGEPDRASSDVDKFADKIRSALAEVFEIEDRGIHIGGSVGSVLFPDGDFDSDGLIEQADRAMYEAKHGGLGSGCAS